ncbi:uncharacterized protein LOC144925589 [Branchiostoma floridae x Branchiostoma belcheri]
MDQRRALAKKYKDYKCYGWLVVMLAAGAAASLIACGVIIVKPIVETKSLEFQQTTCTTTTGYLTGQHIGCSCGKDCHSQYPCLRMTVTYVLNNDNAANATSGTMDAVLFDTEQRLNHDGHKEEAWQCVTAPCERNAGSNSRSVLSFNSTYGAGKNYTCLYHPDAPTKVLLKRLFTWDHMFHSMLWSSIGFVIFSILSLYVCDQCKKIKDKMSSIQVAVPPGAPIATKGHFLPPGPPPGPPPAYPGTGQSDPTALQMQPPPPPSDMYKADYSSGFSYN